MKIVIKDKKFTPWDEVKIGDIFRTSGGYIYIRIEDSNNGLGHFDCVNLLDGGVHTSTTSTLLDDNEIASGITIKFK